MDLDALLARLKRICEDPWLPVDERRLLALQTAEATSSLVVQQWTAEKDKVETLWIRLKNEVEYAIPFAPRGDEAGR